MHARSIRHKANAFLHSFAFSLLCTFLLGLANPAAGQLVTWVKPVADKELGLQLDSVWPGVTFRVTNAETDKPVKSIGELGWQFEKFKLGDVLRASGEGQADTQPVKLTIPNLPPGVQKVYLRYWSAAPGPDQQWYVFMAALGEAERHWLAWYDWDMLVSGLGGQKGALYDRLLGEVGTKDNPATEVTMTFNRYVWGRVARFGGLRIETVPDAETPQTAGKYLTDKTRPIREKLLAGGPKGSSGEPAYGLACTSSMVKVRPKLITSLQGAAMNMEIKLSGARGEWVNGQVVLLALEKSLQVESLSVTTLTDNTTGKTIPSSNSMVAPVGFLFNDISYEAETHGWWPEPILTFLKQFDIPAGDLQPIWYRAEIPRDTPAGIYRAEVGLNVAGAPEAKIPVTVTVWDFTLPEAFHQAMAFNPSHLSEYEEFLLGYHIPPQSIYASKTPTREQLERWSKDPRVSSFNVRYFWRENMDPKTKMPREGDLEKWLDQIGECLTDAEAVGMRDKAYVYLFDEGPQSDMPAFKLLAEAIAKRFPDLLLMTTSYACHLVEPDDDPLSVVKGLCPLLGPQFDYARSLRQRQAGKTIWWYVCNNPRPPYPNVFVLQPGIDHRLLMGFLAYGYDIEGFLYYAMTDGWGITVDQTPRITDGPYVREHWVIRGRGCGNLAQLGPDGPLPNIRIELMRDGLEDYEYLYLAERLAERLQGKKLPADLAKALQGARLYFAIENPVARNTTDFTKDPAVLEQARRHVAGFIVQANAFLNTQAE